MLQNMQQISQAIENALVARNLRGMKHIQSALTTGYYLRAARYLRHVKGHVLIGTGFPVIDTFETDGPVGAIALYNTLEHLGATPVIVCGQPIAGALSSHYRTLIIAVGDHDPTPAKQALAHYQPEAIIAIERPGQAADGGYYNMRGECISQRTACFDHFLKLAQCPTIAIGDGGNEIGMGNVIQALATFNITPSVTTCDELLIADVSNWGAYGLIALLSLWHDEDLLQAIDPMAIFKFLSTCNSVDGVTRLNEMTEDGLAPTEGMAVIAELRKITGFVSAANSTN